MNAEDAFKPTQDRSHFFSSSVANAALDQLQRGLNHALPFIVVIGEPGVGKTAVVREACARWGARVRAEWLAPGGTASDALLPTIVQLFGGSARTEDGRTGWVAALSRALGVVAEQDETPLLIVDDAHQLAPEMLAELARIEGEAKAAKRVLLVVFVGHSKLELRLQDPNLAVVSQHVAVIANVAPMAVADVRTYLNHRLAAAGVEGGERVFSRKAARELHAASGGVPSRLDVLAIDAIRAARAADTSIVVPEHVQAAVDAQRRPGAKLKPPTPARRATDARTPAVKAAPPAPEPAPPTIASVPPAAPAPPPPVVAKVERPAPEQAAAPSEPAAAAPAPEATPAPTRAVRPAKPVHRKMPVPEAPPMDSTHPRVKEWVSRFTDGESGNRFSARMELPPITEPETFPLLEPETPEEVPPGFTKQAEPAPAPVAEPEPAAAAAEPAEPAAPAAPEPAAAAPAPVEPHPPARPKRHEPKLTRRERRLLEREAQRARGKSQPTPAAAALPPPSPTFTLPRADTAPEAPRSPRKLIVDESVTPEVIPLPLPAEPESESERWPVGLHAPHQGRFLHVVVPGLLMLGVATIAIIAGTRGGFDRTESSNPTQASSSAPSTPPVPKASAPAPDTSPAAVEPVTNTAPADTVPPRFCLEVGTYLFSDRARLKARQLEKLTSMNAWVETLNTDGTRSYRVLIGGFATQEQAEKAADHMLTENFVTEAMVLPFPADQH